MDRARGKSNKVSPGHASGPLALDASQLECYFTVQLRSSFTKTIRLSGLRSSELSSCCSLLVTAAGCQGWCSAHLIPSGRLEKTYKVIKSSC